MESSENPKAIYIGSVYPWMKLYYIIAFDSFQRQNLRRGQMIKTRAGVEIVIVVSVCCTNLDKSGFNSNQNSSRGKYLCRYALSLAFVIISVIEHINGITLRNDQMQLWINELIDALDLVLRSVQLRTFFVCFASLSELLIIAQISFNKGEAMTKRNFPVAR